MAQKTEKEETKFKVPETLTLCVNNCGVTGNPATNNMCQKCFNASTAGPFSSPATTTVAAPSAGFSIMKFSSEPSPRSIVSRSLEPRSDVTAATMTSSSRWLASERSDSDAIPAAEKKFVNRCSGCRKRVG